ncbi:nodulation S family protein [Aldersonia sp. NBC_00410]|uniref:SAM-dependent methyltransferase n=1 Tax=Aldersonia sp. NBC_00410 TaxID=2975954 RepID=UPI002257AD4F|nr:SAM-dependent methyltransferase [Aldersonia sp. NBC_00410]MCX5045420.1 nodulation S family protein [Aldersonia sp. NBC_00410]
MTGSSLPADYFRKLYDDDRDPWGFERHWYEERKYALTLAALPQPRYRRCLEPGCSIGVLTARLAARCDEVIATDVVDSAVIAARERVAATPNIGTVRCRQWALGSPWRDLGEFDLIVLSEVGYYLDGDALRDALGDAVDHLDPGGTLVCVHWQHFAPDYPLSGGAVHRIVHATRDLNLLAAYRDEDLDIDVFVKGPARSVANVDGLLG